MAAKMEEAKTWRMPLCRNERKVEQRGGVNE